MGLDVDEAELEHGEEAHGPCAHDDGIGLDHVFGHGSAQNCFSGMRTMSPSRASVTLI